MTAVKTGPPAVTRAGGGPAVLEGFDLGGFRRALLAWFDAEGRALPFRGTTDPYLVLVSETILQQTQVSRGGPAWAAFVARFPTVEALAAATPADVLRAWQGLGYNRRALNLQRAARIVVEELGGRFPTDVAGLERLPGVGPYTARAVASIAFGLPVGAVDTNVRRVLGRAVGGGLDVLAARDLQAVADAVVPPERSARLDRTRSWTSARCCAARGRPAAGRARSPACVAASVRVRDRRATVRPATRPTGPTRRSRRYLRPATPTRHVRAHESLAPRSDPRPAPGRRRRRVGRPSTASSASTIGRPSTRPWPGWPATGCSSSGRVIRRGPAPARPEPRGLAPDGSSGLRLR